MKVLTANKYGIPMIDAGELLNRIPRPERSGCISVTFMLLGMWAFLHPQLFGVGCDLWICRQPAVDPEVTEQEKLQAVRLYFNPGGGTGEGCELEARIDFHTGGSLEIPLSTWIMRSDISAVSGIFGSSIHWYPQKPDRWEMVEYQCPFSQTCGIWVAGHDTRFKSGDKLFTRWNCHRAKRRAEPK